jgi:acyl carrier protein
MEKITKEHICSALVQHINTAILDSSLSIKPDTAFSDVGLDSMSIIEIILFIERKFGVSISEEELIPENLKSVQSLAECTLQHLSSHE